MKPILYELTPQDATKKITFDYEFNGDTIIASQLFIYDPDTGKQILKQTVTRQYSNESYYVLDENILENGKNYLISVRVFTQDPQSYGDVGNQKLIGSDLSDKILLRCYSMPELSITNMPYNSTITRGNYTFELGYNQAEGEQLSSYRVTVYNSTGIIHTRTDWLNNPDLLVTIDGLLPYEVDNVHQGSYYVIAEAYTQYNTKIESEQYPLYVRYKSSDKNAYIEAENVYLDGIVRIFTNLDLLVGESNNHNLVYKDGEAVDLRDGTIVTFDDNKVHINDDWYIKIIGSDFIKNKNVLILNKGQIVLYYLEDAYRNNNEIQISNTTLTSLSEEDRGVYHKHDDVIEKWENNSHQFITDTESEIYTEIQTDDEWSDQWVPALGDELSSFLLVAKDDNGYTYTAHSNEIPVLQENEKIQIMITKKYNQYYVHIERI